MKGPRLSPGDFATFLRCSLFAQLKYLIKSSSPKQWNQNAKINEFLHGLPISFIDPDVNQEHTFSIISSEPPSGMDIFGIGGCTGKLYVKG
jgi:hypothetical protein